MLRLKSMLLVQVKFISFDSSTTSGYSTPRTLFDCNFTNLQLYNEVDAAVQSSTSGAENNISRFSKAMYELSGLFFYRMG
jgi:hypothetical protein